MTPQNRIFSNKYYKNILLGNAFFQSDRALGSDPRTRPYVEAFAANNELFFQNFTCAASCSATAPACLPASTWFCVFLSF